MMGLITISPIRKRRKFGSVRLLLRFDGEFYRLLISQAGRIRMIDDRHFSRDAK